MSDQAKNFSKTIYTGGTPVKRANRYYIVVSSQNKGIEEIEFDSCKGASSHYFNDKGVCLVCGALKSGV